MNQQRARRFRTALDAEVAKDKAIREGLQMPKEDAFDSNCITPGKGIYVGSKYLLTPDAQVPSLWRNSPDS